MPSRRPVSTEQIHRALAELGPDWREVPGTEGQYLIRPGEAK